MLKTSEMFSEPIPPSVLCLFLQGMPVAGSGDRSCIPSEQTSEQIVKIWRRSISPKNRQNPSTTLHGIRSAYRPFQNHYTHEIVIFKLFGVTVTAFRGRPN